MRLSALMLLTTSLMLTACKSSTDAAATNRIELTWELGDTWYVSAKSHEAALASEGETFDFTDAGTMTEMTEESWTPDVVWTYQVVESNFVPDEDDELYKYAIRRDEVEPLTVIRAHVDASLNTELEISESEPVVYLVFRSERNRLAAIISFDTKEGERINNAISTNELGRSWSILSQSSLAPIPTFLAPSAAKWADDRLTLENGKLLETELVGDTQVDVFYDDELGDGLIVNRYESGEPWPIETITDNSVSHLLTNSEVDARRAKAFYLPVPPQDFDYRAALRSSVNIDEAMTITDEDIENEGFFAEVPEQYRPWAGSWWPVKDADLVFGYQEDRETFSRFVRDDVKPLKIEMGEIQKELKDMDKEEDATAYEEKLQKYRDNQSTVVDTLVSFYNNLRADIDGGYITLADGEMRYNGSGSLGSESWTLQLDELSPMDKAALAFYANDLTSNNPFFLPAWEILNSYSPGDTSGWWGHCNGWSAASILTNEPRTSVSSEIFGEDVSFTTADIKGLLTESHYSSRSNFYGARYRGKDTDDITDLSPASFQKLINYYIREQGVALVFDTAADESVWNFPAWRVNVEMYESEDNNIGLININTANEEMLDELPGVGLSTANKIVDYREAWGPFQAIEDITNVSGIGSGKLSDMKDLITVDPITREVYVVTELTIASDAVDEDWVDEGEPSSDMEEYGYTLILDEKGQIIDSTWDEEDSHPDFAWVPYDNPYASEGGSSENPYLEFRDLLEIIGSDFERK